MVNKFNLVHCLLSFVFCLLFKSCIINLDYREAFSDFKHKVYINEDNLKQRDNEISGFYYFSDSSENETAYQYYVFYPDGMVYKSGNIIGYNIESFKQKLVLSLHSKHKKNNYNFGPGLTWGNYKLIGNELILRMCFAPGEMRAYAWEEVFLKKDSITIEYVGKKDLPKNKYSARNEIEGTKGKMYRFYNFDSIPPSDCWLKQRRWFWADKKAFKAYKKEQKKKK